jgi:AbrB family looped-hinge helix DNA binding protein
MTICHKKKVKQMQSIRTKLGEGGRIIIPAQIRHELNIAVGNDIILHIQGDIIYILPLTNHSVNYKRRYKNTLKANSNSTEISL